MSYSLLRHGGQASFLQRENHALCEARGSYQIVTLDCWQRLPAPATKLTPVNGDDGFGSTEDDHFFKPPTHTPTC